MELIETVYLSGCGRDYATLYTRQLHQLWVKVLKQGAGARCWSKVLEFAVISWQIHFA